MTILGACILASVMLTSCSDSSDISGFYKVYDEKGDEIRAIKGSYFGGDGYLCVKLRDKESSRPIPGVEVCGCKLNGIGHYLFNNDGTITMTISGEVMVMYIEYTEKGFVLTIPGTPLYMEFQKVKGDNPSAEDIFS
jgi:hypothetical protein